MSSAELQGIRNLKIDPGCPNYKKKKTVHNPYCIRPHDTPATLSQREDLVLVMGHFSHRREAILPRSEIHRSKNPLSPLDSFPLSTISGKIIEIEKYTMTPRASDGYVGLKGFLRFTRVPIAHKSRVNEPFVLLHECMDI